jgi:O-acetylserine/cysteine efflux transporter
MRPRHAALAVLVALIWGSNFVAIRIGLDDVPPLLFLAIRFVVVCVPAVFFIRRPPLPWRDLLLIGAFISLGQFALLYVGIHLGMPPGLSSLVLQAQVLFTVVIAAVWLRERPSQRQLLGVGLGGAGLVVIAVGRGLSSPLLPLAIVILAAVSWAIGNVLTRRVGNVSGLALTVWSGLVVPLPALALSWVIEGPEAIAAGLASFGWEAAASTAYTAYLSSLVGYGIWNTLLSRHPVASVTPFAMLVPVFGMAAAALAFGERPTLLELLGGLVLLAGVATAVLRRPGPNRPLTQSKEQLLGSRGRAAPPAGSAQAGSPST